MQTPPEISFKNIEPTPYIDKLLADGVAKLEQVCDYIVSTRVALEADQKRHLTGNPYRMRIDIAIPGHQIVIKRSSVGFKKPPEDLAGQEARHAKIDDEIDIDREEPLRRNTSTHKKDRREEPLLALIRRTFEAGRRELEKAVEKQHLDVKSHPQQQIQAFVEKLFPQEGYGFIRSLDGQQIYFHRNSVLHNHWDKLTVGTGVRFVTEMGEKGL